MTTKLIHSAIECGHRAHEKCFYTLNLMDCIPIGEENFPKHCPLQDGIPTSLIVFPLEKLKNKENPK